jgi:uncharacterized protein YbcV (DUF1398 family)
MKYFLPCFVNVIKHRCVALLYFYSNKGQLETNVLKDARDIFFVVGKLIIHHSSLIIMILAEQIKEAYQTATSYPNLVTKLISIGVQSYTVEVANGIVLYRFNGGVHELHLQNSIVRVVMDEFNSDLTVKAVKDNQPGKTTFPEFLNDIAKAGVRFYEATFTGNLRVTYIGAGGFYEEAIPV